MTKHHIYFTVDDDEYLVLKKWSAQYRPSTKMPPKQRVTEMVREYALMKAYDYEPGSD